MHDGDFLMERIIMALKMDDSLKFYLEFYLEAARPLKKWAKEIPSNVLKKLMKKSGNPVFVNPVFI